MNTVYQIGGVSKQAVYKHNHQTDELQLWLEELVAQVDEIRSVHPGCGLEKLFDTLKPSRLGRDKFISLLWNWVIGYAVK